MRNLASAISNDTNVKKCVSRFLNRPINEIPLFGGKNKTKSMIEADREMMERAEAAGKTRKQAAAESVALGWKYFVGGDSSTAMKRFNQAWLFDPSNSGAFHGMAVVTADRFGNRPLPKICFDIVEGLFSSAKLRSKKMEVNLYKDHGVFLSTQNKLKESNSVFLYILSVEKHAPDVRRYLAANFDQMGLGKDSCYWGKQARQHGDFVPKRAIDLACSGSE